MSGDSFKRILGISTAQAVNKGLQGKDNKDTWMSGGDLGTDMIVGQQYRDDKAQSDAKKAADEAVAAAKKLADEQEQAFNKANMKKPNYAAIKAGNAGSYDDTLLGGGSSKLLLGKNTLLGG